MTGKESNYKDLDDYQKTGKVIEDLKQWLSENGIDSSNFEALIKKDLEEMPQGANRNLEDSKGKHFMIDLT